MFSSDHCQGRTRWGGRAEEILNNPLLTLSFSLRKPQLRFDPQKSATHLNRTDVAMVVITVKELKDPFTVLRPEEFLENNRSPCRSTLILLQKLSRPQGCKIGNWFGPGRCLSTSTVAMTLPGCLAAALFFSPSRFSLPAKRPRRLKKVSKGPISNNQTQTCELYYFTVRLGLASWKAECARSRMRCKFINSLKNIVFGLKSRKLE